jgi:hypothetical protein
MSGSFCSLQESTTAALSPHTLLCWCRLLQSCALTQLTHVLMNTNLYIVPRQVCVCVCLQVFDGQPLQLMMKDTSSSHSMLHLTIWHRRMLTYTPSPRKSTHSPRAHAFSPRAHAFSPRAFFGHGHSHSSSGGGAAAEKRASGH